MVGREGGGLGRGVLGAWWACEAVSDLGGGGGPEGDSFSMTATATVSRMNLDVSGFFSSLFLMPAAANNYITQSVEKEKQRSGDM